MKISFVIAVYHNEGAISKTYEKIRSIFLNGLAHHEYEIIFVDDGSKDNSLEEMLSLKEQDPKLKVITFTRNFGQMAAMLAGFKEATGDAVINISADLQDPIELIPQMVESWQAGSEIVICYRTDRSDTLSAKLFSRLAYRTDLKSPVKYPNEDKQNQSKMNPYSSSLNDAEWAVIEPLLDELLPKQTCPHKWSNRLLFDAMLYQLKNGCHWADLPKDFPPYSSVYWHYKQWRAVGIIDKLMSRLHESLREHSKKTSMDKPDNSGFPSGEEYLSCQSSEFLLLQSHQRD